SQGRRYPALTRHPGPGHGRAPRLRHHRGIGPPPHQHPGQPAHPHPTNRPPEDPGLIPPPPPRSSAPPPRPPPPGRASATTFTGPGGGADIGPEPAGPTTEPACAGKRRPPHDQVTKCG